MIGDSLALPEASSISLLQDLFQLSKRMDGARIPAFSTVRESKHCRDLLQDHEPSTHKDQRALDEAKRAHNQPESLCVSISSPPGGLATRRDHPQPLTIIPPFM